MGTKLKMEKLPLCRICLVENVRMYVVVNKNLHELYEKLTDVPFLTEDSRPMLACFLCCTKLKQCYRFLRKCLEAEEMFAQMMNEDSETYPLINPEHLEFFNGFITCPMVHISIDGGGQTESDAIKEGLPAVWERLDEIIDPKEEHQTDELYLKNVDNSYSDVKDTPAHCSESNSEDSEDLPLMDIKTEVEDEQESLGAPTAKKLKLVPQKEDMEKPVSLKHKNNRQEHSKNIENSKHSCFQSINKTDKAIKRHSLRHNSVCAKDRPYKCDICPTSYASKSNLNVHIRTHTGEKPYKCDICQRRFNHSGRLKDHIRTHTGEKPYKCDICQRSFDQTGHLTRHLRTHTGEKPYKCEICQRSFNQRCDLKRHIRTHTGEKPYKCDICLSSFNQSGTLKDHIRTHTGEKPYKCDICHRSFYKKEHLTRHIRIHTGEKPYKSDIC